MNEIMELITNQGFAIAMCTYVIVSVNKTLQDNNKILTQLVTKIDNLEDKNKE